MSTNKIIANLLRDTVSNGSEHAKGRTLKVLADAFDQGLINGTAATVAELAPSTPAAAVVAPAPVDPMAGYRLLGSDERIKAGDQWKLRDGLRTRHPERKNWSPVTESVGDRPSAYSKSIFRRRVAA